MLFTDLPESISYILLVYLSQDDYQQILNTSKRHFGLIRKKTIIYNLTAAFSVVFCDTSSIRNQLLEKVQDSAKQIKLQLDYSKIMSCLELFDRCPVHLICTGFKPFRPGYPPIRGIKELILTDSDFEISNLLDLSTISEVERATFRSCPEIIDISPLKDCKHLIFDHCENITDYSCLGKQESLWLNNNSTLTNVANFRLIRTISLINCWQLTDVSPLKGVYELCLWECIKVSDISCLGAHCRLRIVNCGRQLSGYHVLKDIPSVELNSCDISDLSVLSRARFVYLDGCKQVVDVRPLMKVREVKLVDCRGIEDISMLASVSILTVSHLRGLKKYEGIDHLKNLVLECSEDSDEMIKRFPFAQRVVASYSAAIDNILRHLPSFKNLCHLTLRYAVPFQALEIVGCEDIHTVIFEFCALKSVKGLGRNRVIRFLSCEGIDLDLSSLIEVPFVSIIKCRFTNVKYHCLLQIPRLKISK